MTKNTTSLSIKILKILGVSIGIAAVSILSPTLPYALLKAYLREKLKEPYSKRQIQDSLKYLKRKNFIAFEFKENKIKIALTRLGKDHLKRIDLKEIRIPSIKWDNRWRVLTFDIPENKQGARQTFRNKLKELGFFHFQRSVFLLPYPCEKEIDKIANLLEIRPYICLLTCDRFLGDKSLLRRFKI